ncbi:MAG: hypothetical protein ACP5UV_06450 [Thermoplasmata archaeon]
MTFKYISYSVIVAALLSRKLLRTIYGGKFRRRSIYISPLLYFLFSIAVSINMHIISAILSGLVFAFGVYASYHTTRSIIFFTKNSRAYYKRPVWVVSVWSAAFIGRLTILFFFPTYYGDIFSILLFFATGLIIGEAFQIVKKHREAINTNIRWKIKIPAIMKRKT